MIIYPSPLFLTLFKKVSKTGGMGALYSVIICHRLTPGKSSQIQLFRYDSYFQAGSKSVEILLDRG